MIKHVIIVNGAPESGKTSFHEFCEEYISDAELGESLLDSSINPIKDVARMLGWDGEKSDYWRSVLSLLKNIWISSCDGPTKYIVKKVLDADSNTIRLSCDNMFLFFDIRESKEIQKAKEVFESLEFLDIRFHTVIVRRGESKKHGNDSDDNVENYDYEYAISNDGSLNDLKNEAIKYVDKLINNEEELKWKKSKTLELRQLQLGK